MTEVIAVSIGFVLTFVLQFMKRWVTFTPSGVKGFIILCSVVYAVGAAIATGNFNLTDLMSWVEMIKSLGLFIGSNQSMYALIFNNTDFGERLANPK